MHAARRLRVEVLVQCTDDVRVRVGAESVRVEQAAAAEPEARPETGRYGHTLKHRIGGGLAGQLQSAEARPQHGHVRGRAASAPAARVYSERRAGCAPQLGPEHNHRAGLAQHHCGRGLSAPAPADADSHCRHGECEEQRRVASSDSVGAGRSSAGDVSVN